jgi:hypothetical protein
MPNRPATPKDDGPICCYWLQPVSRGESDDDAEDEHADDGGPAVGVGWVSSDLLAGQT